jgi:hypothetical protein
MVFLFYEKAADRASPNRDGNKRARSLGAVCHDDEMRHRRLDDATRKK